MLGERCAWRPRGPWKAATWGRSQFSGAVSRQVPQSSWAWARYRQRLRTSTIRFFCGPQPSPSPARRSRWRSSPRRRDISWLGVDAVCRFSSPLVLLRICSEILHGSPAGGPLRAGPVGTRWATAPGEIFPNSPAGDLKISRPQALQAEEEGEGSDALLLRAVVFF